MRLRLSVLCLLCCTCSALPSLVTGDTLTVAPGSGELEHTRRRRNPTPPPPPPTPHAPPTPPTPPAPPTPPSNNTCMVTRTLTNMTISRMNPGGFTFNGTVYFAGGSVCADVNCTKQTDVNSMEYFDAHTQKWTLGASVFPVALSGMQCVSLDSAVVCSSGPTYYVWHGPGTPCLG